MYKIILVSIKGIPGENLRIWSHVAPWMQIPYNYFSSQTVPLESFFTSKQNINLKTYWKCKDPNGGYLVGSWWTLNRVICMGCLFAIIKGVHYFEGLETQKVGFLKQNIWMGGYFKWSTWDEQGMWVVSQCCYLHKFYRRMKLVLGHYIDPQEMV